MVRWKWAQGHHSRVENISKRADIRELRRQSFVERQVPGIALCSECHDQEHAAAPK